MTKKTKKGANIPPTDHSSDEKSTLLHKFDALDDIEIIGKNLMNVRISALLAFYKQYLKEQQETERAIMLQKKSQNSSCQIPELYDIYEMFPHIPSKRINVLYHEVCNNHVEGLVDVLLTLDPNDLQYTEDIVEDNSSEIDTYVNNYATDLKRFDMATVANQYLDPAVSDLEKDYLQAVKIRKMAFEEYGIYEEVEIHEESQPNMDEMNDAEKEWYYEMKLKKEKLKKEREFILKKMREEKMSRNTRYYCKGEEELLNSTSNEIKRYQFTRNITFDFEAEYFHFRIVESHFDRLMNRQIYGYQGYQQPYHISDVEYIVNPECFRKFYACKKELAKKHNFLYESMNCYLLFHGTSDVNMENIIKTNFMLSKVGSSTDKGFYGGGFYFSENPSMSM